MAEYELGVFGLSWQEKIAGEMNKNLKGSSEHKYITKTGPGHNVTIVKNMGNEYASLQATGYGPALASNGILTPETMEMSQIISSRLGLPLKVGTSFLSAMILLGGLGKVPYKIWKPKQYSLTIKQKKSLAVNKGFFSKTLKTTANVAKYGTLAALLIGGAYVYNTFIKKG